MITPAKEEGVKFCFMPAVSKERDLPPQHVDYTRLLRTRIRYTTKRHFSMLKCLCFVNNTGIRLQSLNVIVSS